MGAKPRAARVRHSFCFFMWKAVAELEWRTDADAIAPVERMSDDDAAAGRADGRGSRAAVALRRRTPLLDDAAPRTPEQAARSANMPMEVEGAE